MGRTFRLSRRSTSKRGGLLSSLFHKKSSAGKAEQPLVHGSWKQPSSSKNKKKHAVEGADEEASTSQESLAYFGNPYEHDSSSRRPRRTMSLPVYEESPYDHDDDRDEASSASSFEDEEDDNLSLDDSVYTSTSHSRPSYHNHKVTPARNSNKMSARDKLLSLPQPPRPLQRLQSLPSWALTTTNTPSRQHRHPYAAPTASAVSDDEDEDSVEAQEEEQAMDGTMVQKAKKNPHSQNDPDLEINPTLTATTTASSTDDDEEGEEQDHGILQVQPGISNESSYLSSSRDDSDDAYDDSVLNEELPLPPHDFSMSSSPKEHQLVKHNSFDSEGTNSSNYAFGNLLQKWKTHDQENHNKPEMKVMAVDETKSPVDLDETLPLDYLQSSSAAGVAATNSKSRNNGDHGPVDVDSLLPRKYLVAHAEELSSSVEGDEEGDVDVSYSMPSLYSPREGQPSGESSASVRVEVQPLPKDSIYLQKPPVTAVRDRNKYHGPVDLDDTISLSSSTVATSVAGNNDLLLDDTTGDDFHPDDVDNQGYAIPFADPSTLFPSPANSNVSEAAPISSGEIKVHVQPLPKDSVYLQKPSAPRSMAKYNGPVDLDDTISLASTVATSGGSSPVKMDHHNPSSLLNSNFVGGDDDASTLHTNTSFQELELDQSWEMSQMAASPARRDTSTDDEDSQNAEDMLQDYLIASNSSLNKNDVSSSSASSPSRRDPPGERRFLSHNATGAAHSVTGAWGRRQLEDDNDTALQESSSATAKSVLVTQRELGRYMSTSSSSASSSLMDPFLVPIPSNISISNHENTPDSSTFGRKHHQAHNSMATVVLDDENEVEPSPLETDACNLPPVLPKRIPSLFEAPRPTTTSQKERTKESGVSSNNLAARSAAEGTSTIPPCVLCCTRPRSHVCLPCMHFAFCESCVDELYRISCEDCPVCNTRDAVFSKLDIVGLST